MRIGVDEAGKGPVLGSMFAAAVRADPAALPDGVGDSKGIPPDRRDDLASAIRAAAAAVAVAEVPVARIDDPETDMNGLTVAAHADAVSGVTPTDGDEPVPAVADAADTNAVRFERRVGARCPGVTLRAEHGADAAHPVVGAASIVAKVERDAHVADLAREFGDVGSGYPGDPVTREFLETYVEENGDLPDCARSSWRTSRDVLAAADQTALDEF
ncbi:MAG: ribonuclease HII [Salinirussus sp.]